MSDPQLHVLLNRINEQNARAEAIRALCKRRQARGDRWLGVPEVLALLGDPDESDAAMGGADG